MATLTGPASVQRAQMMREAWQQASARGTDALSRLFAFLTAYPPLAQGVYYLLLGLWPLVSVASYESLTGHRGDLVLVEVVGVLELVIGATLCLAAARHQEAPEILFLAFGSAVGVIAVDIHMYVRGFSGLYLLDVALQVGLVAFWLYGWQRARRSAAVAAAALRPATTPVVPATIPTASVYQPMPPV